MRVKENSRLLLNNYKKEVIINKIDMNKIRVRLSKILKISTRDKLERWMSLILLFKMNSKVNSKGSRKKIESWRKRMLYTKEILKLVINNSNSNCKNFKSLSRCLRTTCLNSELSMKENWQLISNRIRRIERSISREYLMQRRRLRRLMPRDLRWYLILRRRKLGGRWSWII